MVVAVLFLAFFSKAFVQAGNIFEKGYSDEGTLSILTQETDRKILEAAAKLDNVYVEYDSISVERLRSLLWECVVQKNIVNETMSAAVNKGMQKNKQFSNFQCISIKGQDTLEKLKAIEERIPTDTQNLIQKGLTETMSFKPVLDKLREYLGAFYKTKSEEIKMANSDDTRNKIIQEVTQKMKLLETILEQMAKRVKDAKFSFFEGYINYAFSTETTLRNIQREGSEKMKKCVA